MWKILTNRCFKCDWLLLERPSFSLWGWRRSVFVWNLQTLSLFSSTSATMMMITWQWGRHQVKTNNNMTYTKPLVETNLSDQRRTRISRPPANKNGELNKNQVALHLFFACQVATCVTSALSVHAWWGFTLSPAPKTATPLLLLALPDEVTPLAVWWGADAPTSSLTTDSCWPQSTAVLFWLFFVPIFLYLKFISPFLLFVFLSAVMVRWCSDGEEVGGFISTGQGVFWVFLCGVSRFKNFICCKLMLAVQWNDS